MLRGVVPPGEERLLGTGQYGGILLRKALRMPLSSAPRNAEPSREQAEHDDVLARSLPDVCFAMSAIGTLQTSLGETPTSGLRPPRPPSGVVNDDGLAPDGSSAPNFISRPSSAPPRHRACRRVEDRLGRQTHAHDDSPPRICEPKLFVIITWYPSRAAAAVRDSPADTMPSPPTRPCQSKISRHALPILAEPRVVRQSYGAATRVPQIDTRSNSG